LGAHGSKPGGRLAAAVAERFLSFMNSYADHFRVHLKSQASNASAYLKGLTTQNLKKNMERMSEADSKCTSDPMQHFITDSPWSYRDVMDHVACDANATIRDEYAAGLIIDESGNVKKRRSIRRSCPAVDWQHRQGRKWTSRRLWLVSQRELPRYY
jgi:SRSO17 transposase